MARPVRARRLTDEEGRRLGQIVRRVSTGRSGCGGLEGIAAAGPGQVVQPGPGPPVVGGHLVQVPGIALDREQWQRGIDRVLDPADERDLDRHPAADPLAAHVDLDHRGTPSGQNWR